MAADTHAELMTGLNDLKTASYAVHVMEVDGFKVNIEEDCRDIAEYCISLLCKRFRGETSTEKCMDEQDICKQFNLGDFLELLDKYIRNFEVAEFTGTEEEYLLILKLIALRRKPDDASRDEFYEKLLRDNERFVEIYQKRGVKSEPLNTKTYWGSRQQFLSGKVIADHVDKSYGPLDPIFGIMLNPTAGRVGPGDSGWMHRMLFDNDGPMAYHSAVHDGFGYLYSFHQIPPGYSYIMCPYLDSSNPLAGQTSGIGFWREIFRQIDSGERKDLKRKYV